MQAKIDEFESQRKRVQKLFDDTCQDLTQQRDLLESELNKRSEELHLERIRAADELATKEEEFKIKIAQLNAENAHIIKERNFEMDKSLKIGEVIDEKNEKII